VGGWSTLSHLGGGVGYGAGGGGAGSRAGCQGSGGGVLSLSLIYVCVIIGGKWWCMKFSENSCINKSLVQIICFWIKHFYFCLNIKQ